MKGNYFFHEEVQIQNFLVQERGNLDFTKSDQQKIINCFWRSLRACFEFFNKISQGKSQEEKVITEIGDILVKVLLETNHVGVLKYAEDALQKNCLVEHSKIIQARITKLLNFEMEFSFFSRFDGKSVGYAKAVLVMIQSLDKNDQCTILDTLIQSFDGRCLEIQNIILQILTVLVHSKVGRDLPFIEILDFSMLIITKEQLNFRWSGTLYQLVVKLLERLVKCECPCSLMELYHKFDLIFMNYQQHEQLSAIFLQIVGKGQPHKCRFRTKIFQILQSRNGYLRRMSADALVIMGDLLELFDQALISLGKSTDINETHGILYLMTKIKNDFHQEIKELDFTHQTRIKERIAVYHNLELMYGP